MRRFLFASALLAATPAFAVTFNSGLIAAHAQVTVDGEFASQTDSTPFASPGTGGTVGVTAALPTNIDTNVTAYTTVSAAWFSAQSGVVSVSWGWNAISDQPTAVATENSGGSNWSYSFTTGSADATFTGTWGFVVNGSPSTFGVQGVYGKGETPFNVTPSAVDPSSGSGSFSVALAANTTYAFGLYNNGNLGNLSGNGGLNSVTGAEFSMEWTITPVPEPQTWALLLAGLGLVAGVARRRVAAVG